MKNISVQLKALRENNNLNQSEMAKILGVKERGAVSLYETGKRKLSLEQFFKLIEHFGDSAYHAFDFGEKKRIFNDGSQIIEENGVMYVRDNSSTVIDLQRKYIDCLEEKDKLKSIIATLESNK